MSSIEVSVDLAHSPGAVWDAVSQLERHSEWMADAERIDFVGEQRRGAGTVMKVRTRVGPLVTSDLIQVEEWVEGERIAVTHRGLVQGEGAFVLEPIATGTRFVWSEQLRFPWYLGGGITAWFARPVLSSLWRNNLSRFAATL